MIFNHTGLTIFFNKVENIREKLFIFESAFNNSFQKPFQLASLPEQAPAEIPRIVASNESEQGLKVILQISQTQLNIQWQYHVSDYSHIHKKVDVSLDLAYAALEKAEINDLLYSGLTLQAFLPFESRNHTSEYLKKTFLAEGVGGSFIDLNCKFTLVAEDCYYVNLSVANKVNYKPEEHMPRMVPAYMTPDSFGVGVMIDLNDRFAFNFHREYGSEKKNGERIVGLMNEIVSTKLVNFLETGKLEV